MPAGAVGGSCHSKAANQLTGRCDCGKVKMCINFL